ncbi:hypothetical protein Tco_0564453 [Tanacetum coccineum]
MRRCTCHHLFVADFLLKLAVRVLLSLVLEDDPWSIDSHVGTVDKMYACFTNPHTKIMIQQNMWMVGVVLDHLVAEYVFVVVARQHPIQLESKEPEVLEQHEQF